MTAMTMPADTPREPSGAELVAAQAHDEEVRPRDLVGEIDCELLHVLRPYDLGRAHGDDRKVPREVDALLDRRLAAMAVQPDE